MKKARVAGLLAVLVLAGGLLVGSLFLLNQEPQVVPTPTPTPTDVALVTVEGEVIGVNFWVEQYRLDQVMSRLAGQAPPAPRETLERLINETLVLQSYRPTDPPPDAAAQQRIEAFKSNWGVDDATLAAQLRAADLPREVLTRTMRRLLTVETAQAQLAASQDPSEWMAHQREQAAIEIDEARWSELTTSLAPLPTLAPSPTATAIPAPATQSTPDPFGVCDVCDDKEAVVPDR